MCYSTDSRLPCDETLAQLQVLSYELVTEQGKGACTTSGYFAQSSMAVALILAAFLMVESFFNQIPRCFGRGCSLAALSPDSLRRIKVAGT